MKYRRYHAVGLVDQLAEGLLLVDSLENHLVLALLAHFFYRGCIDILTVCHTRDLNSAIGDALGCDEFFVQILGHLRLLGGFNEGLLRPELSIDVKVLGFDNVVLL